MHIILVAGVVLIIDVIVVDNVATVIDDEAAENISEQSILLQSWCRNLNTNACRHS